MTSLAPHMEAFLREYLVRQRGASRHTCDSYAYSFQCLFEFASKKFKVAPSALMLEQLDAALICTFLEHLETTRGNSAETRNVRLAVGGGEKVHHFGGQKAPVEWLRLGYMRRRRRAAMVTQDGLSSAGLTCGAR